MVAFLAGRLAFGLVTLATVSMLVFAATEVLPGNVAEAVLGQAATPEAIAAMSERLGLERPAPLRYAAWASGVVQGDFGVSLVSGRAVADLIGARVFNTAALAGSAALLVAPLSLALGLLAATRPGSLFDRGVAGVTLMSVSAPEFLIATVLVMVFAVQLNLLPAVSNVATVQGFADWARAMALPVITLIFMVIAPMTRMTRSAVMAVLGSPAIETAILRGAPGWKIVLYHALPNAVGPIVNVFAMNLAYLVSGVVVVEVIFSYPGLAKLMIDAVGARDLPVVQACALIFCAVYVVVNLSADIVVAAANPKLRQSR